MNNTKKIFLIMLLVLVTTGCNIKDINKTANRKEIIMEQVESIKVNIDDNDYTINLENNDTVLEFIKLLPKEFEMNELNGNEKYVYLEKEIPSNPVKINNIEAGDVMLYGDNCLVIFYKSFTTSYTYTKIGHIDNLPNLGSGSVKVKFVK